MSEFLPILITDNREKTPLIFSQLESVDGTLLTGDYSIVGLESLFRIERKSIDDLVGCCIGSNRNRFEIELERLRGFRFGRILIVGSIDDILAGNYRSRLSPLTVVNTLHAFEARYAPVSVVWLDTPEIAADWIETKAIWFAREILKAADGVRGKQ